MIEGPQPNNKNELEKMRKARTRVEKELGEIFDNRETIKRRMEGLISNVRNLKKEGLNIDENGIINDIEAGTKITDKQEFIQYYLKIFDNFMLLKNSHPSVFESVDRNAILEKEENIQLSKLVYATIEENEAYIHLTPASVFIKEEGISRFKKEITSGLNKLAEIMEKYENIKKVHAVSWIVAKNPHLIESLGFKFIGKISEKERNENFQNEDAPIAEAMMNRIDFLKRYSVAKD